MVEFVPYTPSNVKLFGSEFGWRKKKYNFLHLICSFLSHLSCYCYHVTIIIVIIVISIIIIVIQSEDLVWIVDGADISRSVCVHHILKIGNMFGWLMMKGGELVTPLLKLKVCYFAQFGKSPR